MKLNTATTQKVARKWRNLSHLLKHVGMCGKVRHPNQAAAHVEADRLASIFKINQKFSAYRCPNCYWWHVTSNSYSPARNEIAAKKQRLVRHKERKEKPR